MINQATKMGLMFLGGIALMAAVSVVNENDYEDQLIMTHHKCVDYPMLAECQNYDASEYKTYMMKKHGKELQQFPPSWLHRNSCELERQRGFKI